MSGATQPLVTGTDAQVRQVRAAAERCGIRRMRIDPLDGRRAMLLMRRDTPQAAATCIERWVYRARLDGLILHGPDF